jgi:hypothetical protein
MTVRPFLSHKRQDAADMELLRKELAYSGAVGWQDVRELPLGRRFMALFRGAIGRGTTGFIWWGTMRSLESTTICKFEIPRALRRSTRRWRRRPYPVVPLFVDLDPGADRDSLDRALGKRVTKRLLALQGLVRGEDETAEAYARRAARRYVMDSLRGRGNQPLRVGISAAREPTLSNDLELDWRDLVEANGDPRSPEDLSRMVMSLADIREATQAQERRPHVRLESHVRVPLGALIGWEWNRVRPMRLEVVQEAPDGSIALISEGELDEDLSLDASTKSLGGGGPALIAVSTGTRIDGTLERYAREIDARKLDYLHVSLDGRGFLDGPEINAVARWVVGELGRANDEGGAKHLIVLGPIGLAVRIGATAHGTGATWIPLWDGESSYSGGVEIGGSSAGPGASRAQTQ